MFQELDTRGPFSVRNTSWFEYTKLYIGTIHGLSMITINTHLDEYKIEYAREVYCLRDYDGFLY